MFPSARQYDAHVDVPPEYHDKVTCTRDINGDSFEASGPSVGFAASQVGRRRDSGATGLRDAVAFKARQTRVRRATSVRPLGDGSAAGALRAQTRSDDDGALAGRHANGRHGKGNASYAV